MRNMQIDLEIGMLTKGKMMRSFGQQEATELLLSTCIIKDRVFSQEFEQFLEFLWRSTTFHCTSRLLSLLEALEIIGVVVSVFTPTGRRVRDCHNVFTHMTPSYGMPGRCITVKGISIRNYDGEIIPCPADGDSIGNDGNAGSAHTG